MTTHLILPVNGKQVALSPENCREIVEHARLAGSSRPTSFETPQAHIDCMEQVAKTLMTISLPVTDAYGDPVPGKTWKLYKAPARELAMEIMDTPWKFIYSGESAKAMELQRANNETLEGIWASWEESYLSPGWTGRMVDAVRLAIKEGNASHKLIHETANIWLKADLGIAWEGGVDAAMEAAVREIKKLRKEAAENLEMCHSALRSSRTHREQRDEALAKLKAPTLNAGDPSLEQMIIGALDTNAGMLAQAERVMGVFENVLHNIQAERDEALAKVKALEDDGVVGGQDVITTLAKERDEAIHSSRTHRDQRVEIRDQRDAEMIRADRAEAALEAGRKEFNSRTDKLVKAETKAVEALEKAETEIAMWKGRAMGAENARWKLGSDTQEKKLQAEVARLQDELQKANELAQMTHEATARAEAAERRVKWLEEGSCMAAALKEAETALFGAGFIYVGGMPEGNGWKLGSDTKTTIHMLERANQGLSHRVTELEEKDKGLTAKLFVEKDNANKALETANQNLIKQLVDAQEERNKLAKELFNINDDLSRSPENIQALSAQVAEGSVAIAAIKNLHAVLGFSCMEDGKDKRFIDQRIVEAAISRIKGLSEEVLAGRRASAAVTNLFEFLGTPDLTGMGGSTVPQGIVNIAITRIKVAESAAVGNKQDYEAEYALRRKHGQKVQQMRLELKNIVDTLNPGALAHGLQKIIDGDMPASEGFHVGQTWTSTWQDGGHPITVTILAICKNGDIIGLANGYKVTDSAFYWNKNGESTRGDNQCGALLQLVKGA
jgi:hypothetical protein